MDVSNIILVFIILAMVVVILALLISDRVRAHINIFGKNKFSIEANRQGRNQANPRPKPKRSGQKMPTIWFEAAHSQWRSHNLSGYQEVYLGAGPQNTVRLRADSGADMVQARVYWNGHRYKICNLSRRVPTIVNGKAIREQNLGNGNRIQVGSTILIFRAANKS
ncbi:MAG: hypothetical protein JW953_22080 [Anaerolineae bacterium]|nr:hypothetical protein [Anaerolineae bacterium]